MFLPVAPYEIYFIFPINDRILEIGKVLGRTSKGKGEQGVEKELATLLEMWRNRNWGRAMPGLVASVLLAIAGAPTF